MKILVLGGAGFIGSHLCERLVNDGHDVHCVDDLSTGRKCNILHLLSFENFCFEKSSAYTYASMTDYVFNHIYDLACPASPRAYLANSMRTLSACTTDLRQILALANRFDSKILLSSTSEIYGNADVIPTPEDYIGKIDHMSRRAVYSESKRMAETIMATYLRQQCVDIRIARLFNAYGPRMAKNDGRVMPTLINQSLAGSDLTINGQGYQTRSFCYIDDVVDGLIALMEYEGELRHEPTNIGSTHEICIIELARQINNMIAGGKLNIMLIPEKEDSIIRRCPNITKIKNTIGWEPQIGLDEGLKRTIKERYDWSM